MFEHFEKNMANAIPTDTLYYSFAENYLGVGIFNFSLVIIALPTVISRTTNIISYNSYKSNNFIFCCTNRLVNYSRNRGCTNKEDLYEKIIRRENGKGVVHCITHKHIPRLLQP